MVLCSVGLIEGERQWISGFKMQTVVSDEAVMTAVRPNCLLQEKTGERRNADPAKTEERLNGDLELLTGAGTTLPVAVTMTTRLSNRVSAPPRLAACCRLSSSQIRSGKLWLSEPELASV